jgi:hypothetical protein
MRGYAPNFSYSLRQFVDTIPIDVEEGQIYINVKIEGKNYRFNLDTGSSQGVVYEDTPLSWGKELGNVVSNDAAGYRDTVRVIQLPPFSLGRITVSHYVASVFKRPYSRSDYDAILGFDIFNKGLCCKIDTRQGYLIITDRRNYFDNEPGYTIGYKLKWFVPYILVSPFKRHVDEVLFDTGSRQLFAMNKQSFDTHAYKSKNVNSQVEGRAQGSFAIGQMGAEQHDEVVFLKLDRLKWDDFSFTNVRAMTTQGASRIGAKLLDYGTVTIDGFRRKITFTPYDHADSVVVANRLPHIAYVPHQGRASVGLIMEGSEPYKGGLRQGDTILRIEGKDIATFDDFLKYPFVEGRTYLMEVKGRDGVIRVVKFSVTPKKV